MCSPKQTNCANIGSSKCEEWIKEHKNCGGCPHEKSKNKTWFETLQIETFVGFMDEKSEMIGEHKKLIVLHQCGDNKEALIAQLETMIDGIKTNFDCFAG